ncbi:hypothetical protein C884_01177 [Kocuria palustris PEL]|uniref:Uncharacterized protein n=1 Tax=Kocuria palustris PEL TaxID=1236550 RepID=M2XYD2_9MICC|nr:hypothetical protein C884_01177 [Kocuria palustris PEL]
MAAHGSGAPRVQKASCVAGSARFEARCEPRLDGGGDGIPAA